MKKYRLIIWMKQHNIIRVSLLSHAWKLCWTNVSAGRLGGLFRLNRSDSNLGGLSGRNLPIPQRTPNIRHIKKTLTENESWQKSCKKMMSEKLNNWGWECFQHSEELRTFGSWEIFESCKQRNRLWGKKKKKLISKNLSTF